MEGWARQGMEVLDILYEHLTKQTRAKGYLEADESPIKMQDPTNKGSCHQGYYWVYHCPFGRYCSVRLSVRRSTGTAAYVLKGFKGYLQSDVYTVYEEIGAREG